MPADCLTGPVPAPEFEQTGLTGRSPRFLLTSGQRELVASGLGKAITTPAIGGEAAHSALHTALVDRLQCARKAGQANPIVVGAIPFDTARPSCLYVPAHHEWREKCPASPAPLPALVTRTITPGRSAFTAAVVRAVAAFGREELTKVVLSTMQELQFAQEVDVDAIFRNVRNQSMNGYQFMMPLADGATWLGASPELLVLKQGNRIISNPLAGSARRMDDPEADRLNAEQLEMSAKDQHEHALVIRKIAARLAPICAQLHVPPRPSLSKTEALWHLSTRIEGRLHDPGVSALQLACLLHPTPAVCGFPTEPARQLIAALEPFERGFYSGMVGWCDADGNGEWAVALRCGEVRGDRVRLFAGAGIVDSSRPDAEWAEIQTKYGTMLRACGVSG